MGLRRWNQLSNTWESFGTAQADRDLVDKIADQFTVELELDRTSFAK